MPCVEGSEHQLHRVVFHSRIVPSPDGMNLINGVRNEVPTSWVPVIPSDQTQCNHAFLMLIPNTGNLRAPGSALQVFHGCEASLRDFLRDGLPEPWDDHP